MAKPFCSRCRRPFAVDALLARASGYVDETDSASARCPVCDASLEFRVRPGVLELGYTYWAGAPRFDVVQVVPVPRLRVRRAEGAVVLLLDGVAFHVPDRRT